MVSVRVHSIAKSLVTNTIIVVDPITNETYDCQLEYSTFAIYGRSNPSSLAASIVGIVILFVTVAYIWYAVKVLYNLCNSLTSLTFN